MREDRRRRGKNHLKANKNDVSIKNVLYVSGIILTLGIIAFFVTIIVYNNSLEKIYSDLETENMGDILVGEIDEGIYEEETEETASNLGKSVEELESEIEEVSTENEEVIEETSTQSEELVENKIIEKTEETTKEKKVVEEIIEDPTFIYPVEGEILREYAKDNLVYSETLKEWVTHTGIDIKADKTTVVKAAASGTVTSIKSDPRYGITVIIEHANGYETRYANLLTAEFVVEGEEVEQGQTIGTVGNTAAFEVLDDYHLHFELLKDEEYHDPTIYLQ